MFKNHKLVGTIAGALVALAGLASPAMATLTVTITNPNAGGSFSAAVTALNLTASIGTVRCNVTLNGTLPSQTVAVPLPTGRVQIGSITGGSIAGCSPAVTVRLSGFPWLINIDSTTVLSPRYTINILRPVFNLLGVTFTADFLRAQTNGSTLSIIQPGTVYNQANPALTGTLGAQTWNIGPSPIGIAG